MSPCGLSAAGNKRPFFKGMEGTVILGCQYDDNVNNYSDKYYQRFKNSEDPGRFHIATFDDAIACGKLSLEGTFSLFHKRRTIVNASAYYKTFAHDTIDKNAEFTVGLGQQLTRKTYLHITYSLVPHYYLYHFRDRDWSAIVGAAPEAFQPFDYSKDEVSLRLLRYFAKGTSLTGEMEYGRYFYNKHYTEYDGKRYTASLRGARLIREMASLTLGYSFAYNDAKGYDGDVPGETKQSSDDADDSFREHGAVLGVQWYLPEFYGRGQSLSISGSWHFRDYTSPKGPTIDKTHAGRFDHSLQAIAAYTVSLAKPLALQIEYARTQRWAGSSFAENNAFIQEEKDFAKNKASLTLQYAFGK
jgi:hypothetical protein